MYTEAEREEARYEAWVMTGGREEARLKHAQLAEEVMKWVKGYGWTVLTQTMEREIGDEFDLMTAVIRKGDKVKLIRWNTFNKGFMEKLESGWGIFYPGK